MNLITAVKRALESTEDTQVRREAIAVCLSILERTKVVDCTDSEIESLRIIRQLTPSDYSEPEIIPGLLIR